MALIGISGKISSGKDTVGKIIQIITDSPHFTNQAVIDFLDKPVLQNTWEIKRFADKLKDIVCLLIGCTREQLEDREFKEKELGEEWDKWMMKEIDSDGYTYSNEKKLYFESRESAYSHCTTFPTYEYSEPRIIKLTPRLLMQLIGTECGREIIHPNVWVNALMSEYNCVPADRAPNGWDCPNWIITDMRFPNELKAVKDRGGITIRVNRPGLIGSNHLSENSLDSATFDYTIENNSTLEELIEKVREILTKEKLN